MDCKSRLVRQVATLRSWLHFGRVSIFVAILALCAIGPTANGQDGPRLAVPEAIRQVIGRATDALMPESLPSPDESGAHLIPLTGTPAGETVRVNSEAGLVSLVARDAPLGQVLALLAETQQLNLVFAATTDAHVTVALERVPLETALNAVLGTCGHTWSRQGNIIHVTSVVAESTLSPDVQGRRLEIFELDYSTAADLDLTVKGLLSPVGKSWTLETSPDNTRRAREAVIVEDLPAYVERIAGYIAQADQPPRQVLIEVQILEVDLSDDRKRGVNFEELGNLGNTGISLRTVGMADANSSQSFFLETTGTDLTALVELLQSTNDAKTLASPRLMALNGQLARIQIGEKLGFRVTTTTQTSTLESVQYLEVGVVLEVTPWITRDGRVMLNVKPKVSDGSVSVLTGLPEEQTTEVETNVVLGNGQGIVLGGLIQERDTVTEAKIPLIGDIPYLGVLFQRRLSTKSRSEIIVAIMPHMLPYNCEQQARNDFDVMRARDPLTYGAICANPRPYEPKMPEALIDCHLPRYRCPQDTQAHLIRRLPPIECSGSACSPTIAPEVARLPPVSWTK